MSKMTRKYFPDPDDSQIFFNLPPDMSMDESVNDGKETTEQEIQLALEADSDSDGAPEELAFTASKTAAVSLRLAEEKGRKEVKAKQKEKRLKVEALMREQKEEKAKRLESLASKRLPEDVLEDISTSAPKIAKVKTPKAVEARLKSSHKKFENDHYIPLSNEGVATEFKVAVLDSKSWRNTLSKPGENPVQSFRQNALYNSKIRREPTSAIQAAKTKLHVSGKEALVRVPDV